MLKRCFTRNDAKYLTWMVIAMEFRASSNGASKASNGNVNIDRIYARKSALWAEAGVPIYNAAELNCHR